ncbi:MAG: TIGR01777 family protein [Nitrospirae bacterium]|nr:TIGR01777 family protein [Nitrospirota bacterium]
MKVLICGGTGFIGSYLSGYLLNQGLQVVVLAGHKPKKILHGMEFIVADLLKPELFKQEWFEGVDALINLSGKSIFTFWNEKNKRDIWNSRVSANKNLINFISKLPQKPKVFVSASAVGYYGNRKGEEINEESRNGQGFLAELCIQWEKEARRAEEFGIRSVQVRTAPVIGKGGGFIQQVLKSFRFGFAVIFGSGNQWFPWIHMDDLIHIYHLTIEDETLSGPVNASSPFPVQFKDFINSIRKFKRAIVIPFPAFILRFLFKETADVILMSQKVIPERLLRKGFQFYYPHLRDALKEIFS